MYINWKERLAQSPELRNFINWPEIAASEIPKDKRSGYLINCRILVQILDQKPFESVANDVGVSQSKISKLMSRCLAGNEDEAPPLTNALIPGTQIVPAERRTDLSTFKYNRGATGSFKLLLKKLPNLTEHLDLILIAHTKDQPHSQHIKPKFFFAAFIEFLRKEQWPKDKYPYTEKSLGYESLRKYMLSRLDEITLQKIANQSSKLIIRAVRVTKAVFSTVQIDEHTYDTNCSIHLELGDYLKPLRVSRISLIVAVDVVSQAILSYVVVLNRSSNQRDVLECLSGIYRKWSPKVLTCPGLQYSPSDGFPCGNIYDEDNAPSIGELQLDNALAHIANSVRTYVTNALFSTYNLGIPASPKGRNWVEYAFNLMTVDAHRVRSTTGSNAADPNKESKKNSANPPVISLQALEETIEILLAHHNSRRRPNLGGNSPLEIIEYQLNHLFIPRLTRDQCNTAKSPNIVETVTVHYQANDNRAPYINFHHLRYNGACLNNPMLLNQKVEIHIDDADLRKLSVYRDGVFLGEIYAPKSWQRFAHSYRTRTYIFDLIRDHSISGRIDPLVNYFNYLLVNKHLPKTALELVRVYREFTAGKAAQYIPGHDPSLENLQEMESDYAEMENKFPAWNPSLSGIFETNI